MIATAAAALSDELFGFRAQWLWTLVFGACAARPRAARADRLRPALHQALRRLGCPLALAYLTWWVLDGRPRRALGRRGRGRTRVWREPTSSWRITVSWVPYAADYTRFAKTRRGAFAGTGVGYFVPDVWLLALGAVLVLSRDLGDPAAPAAVVAGGFAGDRRSLRASRDRDGRGVRERLLGAVSLQNAFPVRRRSCSSSSSRVVATLGALVVDIGSYQSFLLSPRLRVRAALRRAAGRLALGRGLLRRTTSSHLGSVAHGPHRRVDRGIRPLPVALPDQAVVVDRPRRRAEPAGLGIGATVPSFLVSRDRSWRWPK